MGFPGSGHIAATLGDLNSEKSYSALPAHMNTVVANEAFVGWLRTQLSGAVNVYGLNPGLIYTEIRNNYLGEGTWMSYIVESMIKLVCKSADQYSERCLVYCMVSPDLEERNGALIGCDRAYLQPNPWLEEGDHRERVMQEANVLLERALKN